MVEAARGAAGAAAASVMRGRARAREAEALDLAGRGLRQFGDELDRARIFVGREPVLDEALELRFVDMLAGLQHHEGLGLGEPVGVGRADDGGLENGRVLDEGRLDLERADIDAADLQHVVGAPGVG